MTIFLSLNGVFSDVLLSSFVENCTKHSGHILPKVRALTGQHTHVFLPLLRRPHDELWIASEAEVVLTHRHLESFDTHLIIEIVGQRNPRHVDRADIVDPWDDLLQNVVEIVIGHLVDSLLVAEVEDIGLYFNASVFEGVPLGVEHVVGCVMNLFEPHFEVDEDVVEVDREVVVHIVFTPHFRRHAE